MTKVVLENSLKSSSCRILGNEKIVVRVESKCMSIEERNMSPKWETSIYIANLLSPRYNLALLKHVNGSLQSMLLLF